MKIYKLDIESNLQIYINLFLSLQNVICSWRLIDLGFQNQQQYAIYLKSAHFNQLFASTFFGRNFDSIKFQIQTQLSRIH